MKKISIVGVLCMLAAAVWTTGCGGSGGSAACDLTVATFHYCQEYSNLSGDQATAEDSACTAGGGKKVDSCPTANSVGSCTVTQSGITYTAVYYSDNGVTADSAKTACEASGGTFAAGS